MKFDKDALLKHKFWVLLGVFGLVWLLATVMLTVQAAGSSEKRKEYDSAKQAINGIRSPKNDKFQEPWRQHQAVFQKEKNTVWSKAWDLQKTIATWPSSSTAPLGAKLKYYDDPFTTQERSEFRLTLYDTQFKDLDKRVAPVELKGGVDALFRPVRWVQIPSVEECWLAQEDFWVKRDLLDVVREALEKLARFERVPVPAGEALPTGIVHRHRFRNSLWEVDILVERDAARQLAISKRSRIKNVHSSKRVLQLVNPRTNQGLSLRLTEGSNVAHVKRLEGEGKPLAWNESCEWVRWDPVGSVNLDKDFQLDIEFDWFSSPIKRIDDIQVPRHSHRTAGLPLKPNPALRKDEPAPGEGGGTPPAGGDALAGGAAPGTGSEGSRLDQTPNGLSRNRYIHVTPQCRSLPLGMVVIVDQSHIHDVVIALANSRLRIQITQVHFRHAPDVAPPPLADAGAVAGTVRPPVGGVPTAPPPGTTGRSGPGNDPAQNLVELSIYGIASLYERYPPKPPAVPAGQGDQPPTGGTGMPPTPMPGMPPGMLPGMPPGAMP